MRGLETTDSPVIRAQVLLPKNEFAEALVFHSAACRES